MAISSIWFSSRENLSYSENIHSRFSWKKKQRERVCLKCDRQNLRMSSLCDSGKYIEKKKALFKFIISVPVRSTWSTRPWDVELFLHWLTTVFAVHLAMYVDILHFLIARWTKTRSANPQLDGREDSSLSISQLTLRRDEGKFLVKFQKLRKY